MDEQVKSAFELGTCEHCGAQTIDGECTKVMRLRFEAVTDAVDWKAPIDKIIPAEAARETVGAIIHYTATVPEVTPEPDAGGIKMVRITADGYRNGPAGP